MLELFNPKVCFARELKSSWSCNIKPTKKGSSRIPIANIGQEITLQFDHSGKASWFLGLVPLTKGWSPEDVTQYSDIVFCYFADTAKACCVGLRDEKDNDSPVVNVTKQTPIDEAICEIRVPVNSFKPTGKETESFNIEKVKFIKFTGGAKDNFYISRLRLE